MAKLLIPKTLPWLGITLIVLACGVPALPFTSVATPVPGSIETSIVQTVAAAQTQTALFRPPATFTPTETLVPTSTFTETPTSTATIIFVFPTATRTHTATPTDDGLSDEEWDCRLVSRRPANNTTFDPQTDFDARWTVQNTGTRTWNRNNIDYIYYSGTKMHKKAGYDLTENVEPGETVVIIVDMIAPKNDGDYTTTWTLRSGSTEFCRLGLTIIVD